MFRLSSSLFWTFTVATAFAATFIAPVGVNGAEVNGYLVDKLCIDNCANVAGDQTCTPDNVNVLYHPEKHTGWCLLLSFCVESGYVLMSEYPNPDSGVHDIILNLANEESQPDVLTYIESGSNGMFPLVTVMYNESNAEDVDGVIHAYGVTVKDPWSMLSDDGANSNMYGGDATYQVLCTDPTSPNMETNNYCFRSDVVVTESSNGMMMTIESNACPDHAIMQGSSGMITNSQVDPTATESSEEKPAGGCCGGCGGGCCSSCNSCSGNSTCAGGDICYSGCGSCSGGCGSCSGGCDSCSGGCDSCSGGCSAVSKGNERYVISSYDFY